MERTDEGDFQVFEGVRSPMSGFLWNMAGRKPEDYTPTVGRLDEVRSGVCDPAKRIKDQDIDYGNEDKAKILWKNTARVHGIDT